MANHTDPLFLAFDGFYLGGTELAHVRSDGALVLTGDCHDDACRACAQTRGYGVPWTPSICIHRGRPTIDIVDSKAGFGSPRIHSGSLGDYFRSIHRRASTRRVSELLDLGEVLDALLEERGNAVVRCVACGRWNYHLRGCPLFGRSR